MKNFLLFFLIVINIVTGCKKDKPQFDGAHCSENCFILKGQIVDTPGTNKLSDVELKFYYKTTSYLSFPTYLGVTKTDGNGEYSFQFDGTNYQSNSGFFYIIFSKVGYIYSVPTTNNQISYFNLDSSNIDVPFIQNFTFVKTANLSVHFKATQITNFQFLTFTYKFGYTGYGIILNGNRAIDTTVNYTTAGDIRTFIHWDALGNGVNIQSDDTILIPANTENFYNVDL